MVDGPDAGHWSEVAEGWSRWWGAFSEPARSALVDAAGIRSGSRVLDVGCGAGELLAQLTELGASASGVDPAEGMVAAARRRAPDAEVRRADAEQLPWAESSFDMVTAVNALQFADYPLDALDEFARVLVPGGLVAIANWAEEALNDLDAVERAIAEGLGDPIPPGGELRRPGGLEAVLGEAGLEVIARGVVATPWQVDDDEQLVDAILLGEDAGVRGERAPLVLAAAAPFRTTDGGYRLENSFRWAVARIPN